MSDRKYGNVPTDVDGYTFASRAEARRYGELALLLRAGAITDLTVHPRWPLHVNGVKVATYIADFAYSDVKTGALVCEDVKSEPTKTALYRIKKKLMMAVHGIVIVEIDT